MIGAGNYYYMTHWNEMVNGTAVLTVENVAIANQGIYSASYMGDTPLYGSWMRLIVRGLFEVANGTVIQTQNLRHVLISANAGGVLNKAASVWVVFLLINLIVFNFIFYHQNRSATETHQHY